MQQQSWQCHLLGRAGAWSSSQLAAHPPADRLADLGHNTGRPSLHLDIFISKGMAPGKSVSKVRAHLSQTFTLSNKGAELHSGRQSLLEESRKDKCSLNISYRVSTPTCDIFINCVVFFFLVGTCLAVISSCITAVFQPCSCIILAQRLRLIW